MVSSEPTVGRRAVLRLLALLAILIAIAGFFLVMQVRPTSTSFLPACQFHALTGLFCPGCGSTRALHELSHLDFVGAVRQNLFFMFIGLPVMIWFAWNLTVFALTGRWRHPAIANRKFANFVVVFVISFWALRNIPVAPFTFLAPVEFAEQNQPAS